MSEEFVVDNAKFRSIDVTQIGNFIDECPDIIKEFEAIKSGFNDINTNLLKCWVGEGSDEYAKESSTILSKIGNLKDVLDEITEGTIKDIRDSYSKFDEEMGEYNKNPFSEEE